MSFATTRDRFNADARRCEQGCSSPARLFVMRPDAEHETLVDIKGQKYSDLPTAFVFRTSFDPGCTCRGSGNGGPANAAPAEGPANGEGEMQSDLKTVVQAALAIAASAPHPGDGREPLRAGRNSAGDDASGVGSGPIQGQGSLTQAEAATNAIAPKSKSANSAKSVRSAKAAIARKRAHWRCNSRCFRSAKGRDGQGRRATFVLVARLLARVILAAFLILPGMDPKNANV